MGHKYVKEEDTFSTSQNGTVPKPTAQEVSDGKVLGANGTWVAQSGGGGGGTPYASNPEMDGVASPGSTNDYARGDHVHPSDTAKQNDIGLSIVGGVICQTYEVS